MISGLGHKEDHEEQGDREEDNVSQRVKNLIGTRDIGGWVRPGGGGAVDDMGDKAACDKGEQGARGMASGSV